VATESKVDQIRALREARYAKNLLLRAVKKPKGIKFPRPKVAVRRGFARR
jgi:hypothetical protein